jgi:hypothetical protein
MRFSSATDEMEDDRVEGDRGAELRAIGKVKGGGTAGGGGKVAASTQSPHAPYVSTS